MRAGSQTQVRLQQGWGMREESHRANARSQLKTSCRLKLIRCLSFYAAASSIRLFGADDIEGEGTEPEGPADTGPAQSCPSYAETAALPASGPVTATLTGL